MTTFANTEIVVFDQPACRLPARRADDIIRINLSLFSPDGRASCAYIYPLTVNDRTGRFADPYANDQDWTLVHALQLREE